MVHNIIIERDVMVSMRDGVRLATDIYRPDDGTKHPALVNGHPYDNDHFLCTHELVFSPLVGAQQGYAVVVQEARGRAGSEGTWRPFHRVGAQDPQRQRRGRVGPAVVAVAGAGVLVPAALLAAYVPARRSRRADLQFALCHD
jgi:hypothetical protein